MPKIERSFYHDYQLTSKEGHAVELYSYHEIPRKFCRAVADILDDNGEHPIEDCSRICPQKCLKVISIEYSS